MTKEKNIEKQIQLYKPKKQLNPDIFNKDNIMDSKIRLKLLDIVDDFIKTLAIDWVKPKHIFVIGSIVNYNWGTFSDIDINIAYDFTKIYKKNTDFVADYMWSKRNEWNQKHEELTIKGFPVELTVVDVNKLGVSSGIYDLEKNKWEKEPVDLDDIQFNVEYIKSYCSKQMTKVDEIIDKIDTETDTHKLEKLSKKLEQINQNWIDFRKKALQSKQKEMSNGNIIMKILKHSGYVQKVRDYINKAYDKQNSIKEHKSRTIILTETQARYYQTVEYYNNLPYMGLKNFIPYINARLNTQLPGDNKTLSKLHDIIMNTCLNTDKDLKINGKYCVERLKKYIEENENLQISIINYWNTIKSAPKTKKIKTQSSQPKPKKLTKRELLKQDEEERKRLAKLEMPAAYMDTFINTDDTSEISENKKYLKYK